MPQLLWDASALSKRYVAENGSSTVDHLFTVPSPATRTITFLGYAETAASLRRKMNQGAITPAELGLARRMVESEILNNPDFELLSISDADILSGIALTDRYNLNSTDAAILVAFLGCARSPGAPAAVVIASDQRLLRAGAAEGLHTLNPELVAAADVPTFLASL